MPFHTKMTVLANGVRELDGTTTEKSLEDMISSLDIANSTVSEQTDLITQIKAAIEALPTKEDASINSPDLPDQDDPGTDDELLGGIPGLQSGSLMIRTATEAASCVYTTYKPGAESYDLTFASSRVYQMGNRTEYRIYVDGALIGTPVVVFEADATPVNGGEVVLETATYTIIRVVATKYDT